MQVHGERIEDLDGRDGTQFRLSQARGERLIALDVHLHGLRVEGGAVLEGDPRAQMQRERQPVGGPVPACRELRHEAHFGVGVDELVAERGEDVPVEKIAAARGIERAGIAGDADVEHIGRLHRRGSKQERQKEKGELRAHRLLS